MDEYIDLCKILKDCPKGTALYSTVYGKVLFQEINIHNVLAPIRLNTERDGIYFRVSSTGQHDGNLHGECTLFPDKKQRDWLQWKCPKSKTKEDLCPGSLVLVRDKNFDNSEFILAVYYKEGYVNLSNTAIDDCICGYDVIIPFTFGNQMPTIGELRSIIITDENNYGRSYWSKFEDKEDEKNP